MMMFKRGRRDGIFLTADYADVADKNCEAIKRTADYRGISDGNLEGIFLTTDDTDKNWEDILNRGLRGFKRIKTRHADLEEQIGFCADGLRASNRVARF